MKEVNYTFIGYGPSKDEVISRDKERKCLSVKFNEYGESEFFCNNDVEPYIISFIPLRHPIKIWIDESMICDKCLDKLKNEYGIDFKKEIPKWCLQKGTHQYKEINYKDLPLLKELETWYKNNNHNDEYFFNPEIRWFLDVNFLRGIPIYWLSELELRTCISKGSSIQGDFNGPDYIFRNKKNNKLLGLEITSYKWNIFNSFKNVDNIKKFSKKQIFNTYTFDDRVNEFKNIVKNKSKKKYHSTDELYLGIVVNNTLVDYEYYVLEIILNNWIEKENIKLNGVV